MLVSFQAGNGIQEHCKNEEQNLIWTGNASPSVKRDTEDGMRHENSALSYKDERLEAATVLGRVTNRFDRQKGIQKNGHKSGPVENGAGPIRRK